MSEKQSGMPTILTSNSFGDGWNDPVSAERQVELQALLDRWDAEEEHGERKGPFDNGIGRLGVRLTGADVCWLAEKYRDDIDRVDNLHLEGANLTRAHLEKAHLRGAHLERANLIEAHLSKADLSSAYLKGTLFSGADLRGASLVYSKLQGAVLIDANLEDTSLRLATLDSTTNLNSTTPNDKTLLGDIQWGGVGSVNLTQIDWSKIPRLGDEVMLSDKGATNRHELVVRAYRQLAAQLRAQGMSEVADRFLYRGQVLQRRVLRRQRSYGAALGSWFLDLISGYGYKPMRSLITYIVVIGLFAAAYLINAQFAAPHLTWDEALVLSISAFHGRGFFTSGISLGDTLARLAAGEAIIGLLIEITFIATFTQRFFAR